jgi:hypothetical protein
VTRPVPPVEGIITAGAHKQRALLSRLSADELSVVAPAMALLVDQKTARTYGIRDATSDRANDNATTHT